MADDLTLERLLPHSLEAERSVLGAILLDNRTLNEAIELLTGDDFYRESHRRVFLKMIDLWEKSRAIDLVTLKESLADSGELERVGGPAYLASLVDGVPRSTNIEHYARIVKEKSVLRSLIFASNQVISKCYAQDEELDSVIDLAERSIFEIAEGRITSGFVPIKDIAKASFKTLDQISERRGFITGVATPFIRFNELTSGLQPSDLVVIASRPAMGKTSLSLNIAQFVGKKEGNTVGIFSMEMSREQLLTRMLCSEARVDAHKMKTGYLGEKEWRRLGQALEVLSRANIFIDDSPSISIVEMRAKARKLMLEHSLTLLVVDYLQLMQPTGQYQNRVQEISSISRALKGLAKELRVPVVALSQLSRAPDIRKNHRPQLSDLRESGSIEQDADLVCFIYREEEYEPLKENEGLAELIIGKQRNGPTGMMKLVFRKEFTTFFDLSTREEEM
ncbi:MAG: replicative DNA helicase [Candidatus Aminicenantes bacterium]|nr:replicative DNA helicase [Candidatus Aminicenantes bacterium]MDH5714322.1 replicative DNA helicase [Candidatus Aminicenantes bacterium]